MKGTLHRAIVIVLLLGTLAGAAWAKDNISISVTPLTGPAPIIVGNGQPPGTMQLFYTVNAYQFTVGQFATFNIHWVDNVGSPQATTYPAGGIAFNLVQSQQGGNVGLSASPSAFALFTAGQTGDSTITVTIENSPDGTPPPSTDNTTLVGNLKLDAGSKVGTVTNVQVFITLLHPTNCLQVYTFVTDQDFALGILTSTSITIGSNGQWAGKVKGSHPSQYSDNVLIANGCASDQSFDLRIALDPDFETNPHNNPGQAVFTYSTAGIVDPTTFSISLFGTGTGQRQNLCLQNVTVAANTTFLATVHSQVITGISASSLPSDGNFSFGASLEDANSACSGGINTLASPNPGGFSLPFTTTNN